MPLACLRSLFSLAFVASLLILAGAFYLEFTKGLVPCPLCQSQRVLLVVFAGVCLAARLHAPGQPGARRYAAAALGLALGGGLLAVRQIWLQGSGVAAGEACSMPLGALIEQGSLADVLHAMLLGRLRFDHLELSGPEPAGVEPPGLPAAGGAGVGAAAVRAASGHGQVIETLTLAGGGQAIDRWPRVRRLNTCMKLVACVP